MKRASASFRYRVSLDGALTTHSRRTGFRLTTPRCSGPQPAGVNLKHLHHGTHHPTPVILPG